MKIDSDFFGNVFFTLFCGFAFMVGVGLLALNAHESAFIEAQQEKIKEEQLLESLSQVEKEVALGLVDRVGFEFGRCKTSPVFYDVEDCQVWATSRVVERSTIRGDVDLARAKVRIMNDLGLRIDPKYKEDLDAAPDLKAALAALN